MSRTATVEVADWGDGKHTFRLAIGELRELQEKTGHGPRSIARRIAMGEEFVDEINEVLRIGLIGGGMAPQPALKLVERYGPTSRPLIESIVAAQLVINAAIVGVPEEPVGKKAEAAEDQTTSSSQTSASPSPPSTASAPPSGTAPATSID